MRLTPALLEQYDRDGFLILPELFTPAEIERLRQELTRLGGVEAEGVVKEKGGAIRTIFRVHDEESPTASDAFHALARCSRMLEPAQAVLRDPDLYIHHSKCNLKAAIDGDIWAWHQDYGYWQNDGFRAPDFVTTMVAIDPATEIGGCLYFIPGSHKLGRIEPEWDDKTTSYATWVVPKSKMLEIMDRHPDPVPITGSPGTAVMFHPNILHASGHNLSKRARWHVFMVYCRVANRPQDVPNPRPEWVRSRKWRPLQTVSDDAILQPARRTEPVGG
jgi:ectoine hydroxylase